MPHKDASTVREEPSPSQPDWQDLEGYHVELQDALRHADTDDVRDLLSHLLSGLHVRVNDSVYTGVRRLNGRQIEKGQLVIAASTLYNPGADLVEILGLSGTGEPYGDGGVEFGSVQEVMDNEGVDTLKALQIQQDTYTYGHQSYIISET